MQVLSHLGIPAIVQKFFEPYCSIDQFGNLRFDYGRDFEYYGIGAHRPPLQAAVPWTAGTDGGLVKEVFVCSSAMEAIAYLSINHIRYQLNTICVYATGNALPASFPFPKARITLLFDNTPLGKLWDIKIGCLIRKKPLSIRYDNNQFIFQTAYRKFRLDPEIISLSTFEKASGIRTQIKTAKAKGHNTFLEQLLNSNL